MALASLARRVKETPLLSLQKTLILRPICHIHHPLLLPPAQPIHCNPSSVIPLPMLFPFHTHLQKHLYPFVRFFSDKNLYESGGSDRDGDEICEPDKSIVDEFIGILKKAKEFPSEGEFMAFLDESGVRPSVGLVYSAIWVLKHDWRLALWAFKWGLRSGCNDAKSWNLMIWVLGNQKKFNIAWCMIRDMHRSSMDARRAMLIMIDRYTAANDPCKAIKTYHAMEKFRMTPDSEAFHFLLHALCNHGNIEEAEELMLLSKKYFPLDTEGFNIILNGWCNILVDVLEAKRIWRDMSKCCITPDSISYTHMISCFSKVGDLFNSLRLFHEMKKRGLVAGLEVHNSLISVLTRENCLRQALNILDKMKEAGLQPDSATYNSMILPLCEAQKLEEAQRILTKMIGDKLEPTIETYHAFLAGSSLEGTLELLNRMAKACCGPNSYTFLQVLKKFFKLDQPANALKIWVEMRQYEVSPDSRHYTVLIQGLVQCGWLVKAREFYSEMMSRGYCDDPKLKKLLNVPVVMGKFNIDGLVRNKEGDIHVPLWKGGIMGDLSRNGRDHDVEASLIL